jgi:hypothetical protein
VLCADNQITYPANHKYYECKIYPIPFPTFTIAATFAGNPNLMKSFWGKFAQAVTLVAPPPATAAKVQDVIETVLSMMDLVDSDPDGLHLMIGIAVGGSKETLLLKTERKIVSIVQAYDYIGVGDSSLLRYLGPLLTGHGEFITKQAVYLGSYLVLSAKRYVEGCGGDTDVYVVKSNGQLESRSNQAYNIEQNMLRLEHHLHNAAPLFFDRRVSKETLAKSLERFVRALQDDHHEMQITPPTPEEG